MRSQVPDGNLAAIIEQAVTEKLERLEAKRFAKTRTPRKTFSKDRHVSFVAPDPGRGQASGQ